MQRTLREPHGHEIWAAYIMTGYVLHKRFVEGSFLEGRT